MSTVLWKRSQNSVCLRAFGLGVRVIDVLDREIQLVLVPFGIAAELAAAVSQHAQQLAGWAFRTRTLEA